MLFIHDATHMVSETGAEFGVVIERGLHAELFQRLGLVVVWRQADLSRDEPQANATRV